MKNSRSEVTKKPATRSFGIETKIFTPIKKYISPITTPKAIRWFTFGKNKAILENSNRKDEGKATRIRVRRISLFPLNALISLFMAHPESKIERNHFKAK